MKYTLICSFIFFCCAKNPSYYPPINGITLEGSSTELSFKEYKKIDSLSPNYVAVIPFAYLKSSNSSTLIQHPNWQWWGEDSIGIIKTISMAKKCGHKIMIKPQLWIQPAFFTGDYKCSSVSDWEDFEIGYLSYILENAKIAEVYGAHILCIGNEMKSFIKARPEFWAQLILKVREVYTGKVTYAANWDNYKSIPFWSELDFIGINAYFPLLNSIEPNLNQLNKAWSEVKDDIENLSFNLNKKVMFTEYGYRSIEATTTAPWESYTASPFSGKAQCTAYQSFYETFWNCSFVEGGFLWKWRVNGIVSSTDKSYSIFGKPAVDVVKKYYDNKKY